MENMKKKFMSLISENAICIYDNKGNPYVIQNTDNDEFNPEEIDDMDKKIMYVSIKRELEQEEKEVVKEVLSLDKCKVGNYVFHDNEKWYNVEYFLGTYKKYKTVFFN